MSAALPDRARTWADAHAPHAVVDVTAIGGGITSTMWLLRLAEGEPLVIRWSTRWSGAQCTATDRI